MAATEADRLRALLGERKPPGGSDTETLFSDAQIEDLLVAAANNLERAAYEGWRIKQAEFANLVDTTEGNSQRKMSDLQEHAESMVKLYGRAAGGNTEGRTRIGRIVRTE